MLGISLTVFDSWWELLGQLGGLSGTIKDNVKDILGQEIWICSTFDWPSQAFGRVFCYFLARSSLNELLDNISKPIINNRMNHFRHTTNNIHTRSSLHQTGTLWGDAIAEACNLHPTCTGPMRQLAHAQLRCSYASLSLAADCTNSRSQTSAVAQFKSTTPTAEWPMPCCHSCHFSTFCHYDESRHAKCCWM